jgi:hypothetical protein
VVAVGRRTADYRARDYILEALYRDRRPNAFHLSAKKPTIWALDRVQHLPDHRDVKVAAAVVMLNVFHHRLLAKLFVLPSDGRLRGVLTRLWNCPPHGVKVVDPYRAAPNPRVVCRLSRLCPWCYARRLGELADELRRVLRGGPGRFLALARLSLPRRAAGYLEGPKLTAEEVQDVRRRVGALLRDHAVSLGLTGGLLAHQVGPDQAPAHLPDGGLGRIDTYRHELSVLGHVVLNDPEAHRAFLRRMGLGGPTPTLMVGGRQLRVQWWLLPDLPQGASALRNLLGGSSTNFPVEKTCLQVTPSAGGGNPSADGIPGAFALQPLFMLDPARWVALETATRGARMYDLFGDWRTQRRMRKPASHRDQFSYGPPRSQRPLFAANGKRVMKRVKRIDRLFLLVRDRWPGWIAGRPPRPGRPPLYGPLRELLADVAAHATDPHTAALCTSVSERDIRRLSRRLRPVRKPGVGG